MNAAAAAAASNNNNNNNNNNNSNNSKSKKTHNNNNNNQNVDGDFELPVHMPEEDIIVVRNILIGLQSLGTDDKLSPLCVSYRVDSSFAGYYLLRAVLPSSNLFELELEDMLFIQSINPARIERVAITRSVISGPCELIIKVLDCKQRVMVVSLTNFFATRKLKRQRISL